VNKEIREFVHSWLVAHYDWFTESTPRSLSDKVDLVIFLPGLPIVRAMPWRKDEQEEIKYMLEQGELWADVSTAALVAAIEALSENVEERLAAFREATSTLPTKE